MPLSQFDAQLELSLDLLGLDKATIKEIYKLLGRLEKELIAKLAGSDLTDFNKARLAKQLKEVEAVIKGYYSDAADIALDATNGAAQVSASATASALTTATGATAILPTANMLDKIAGNSIIQGAVQSDYWIRQAGDIAFRFAQVVRMGLVAAETNQQIISRVRGVMDVSRKNAATLVQTSIMTVANDARMATFEQNDYLISGYQWVSALDSHTCIVCASLDGKQWDKDKEPKGHKFAFSNPPKHYNCRCLIIPLLKLMGGKQFGTRASSDGQIPAGMTFEEYLERKGKDYQDSVLGKGRAELWRDKKLTLEQLVSGGKEITLKQLRGKYEHRS